MKKLFCILLVCVMLFALAACAGSQMGNTDDPAPSSNPAVANDSVSPGNTDEQPMDIKIGICLSDHTNTSFIAMLDAARAYAAEDGHITIIEQDGKSDAEAIVSAIENFIVSECDAIIYQNSFPEVTDSVIKEAVDTGICVIAYESYNENATFSWVSDNETIGKSIGHMAGEWINANCNGEGKLCVICNDSIEFLKARGDAIVAGVLEVAPNSEVIVRQPARAITDGYTLAETLLISNPEINCYVGTGDAAAVGVSQAYEAAGWTGVLGTFGADCTEEAVAAMKTEGTFVAGSVNFDLANQMVEMVKTCYAYCAGEETCDSYVVMQSVAVTRDNVLEYFPD